MAFAAMAANRTLAKQEWRAIMVTFPGIGSDAPKFHEGQDVEVAWMRSREYGEETPVWCKAKIVRTSRAYQESIAAKTFYFVHFQDGSRGAVAVEHIRSITP